MRQRDVVGNIMQEWLQGWLDARGIEYAPSENTQMPPDFFLNPDDKTKNLLEVKAFNRSAGPGFDIADFRMYQEEIVNKPYMLDVDYLIFGYDMSEDGIVTIKGVWLKKVWEITRRMEDWSINLQIKDKVVHKIRPGIWYSDPSRMDYSIFESLEDFISAMEEAVFQNPKTHNDAGTWKTDFLRNYKKETGIDLVVPRWSEIKNKYDLKTPRQIAKVELEIAKVDKQIGTSKKRIEKYIQMSAEYEEVGLTEKRAKIQSDKEKIEEKLKKQEMKKQALVENLDVLKSLKG